MEREIFEYLYGEFDKGDDWRKSLNDLTKSTKFIGKTKKEIRFYLRKMENEGFLSTYKLKDDEYITIFLKGFLYYEEKYFIADKIFTNLLIKFLEFVRAIDNNEITLRAGRGNQIGTFPLLEFYKHLGIDESFEKKMLFIQHESQKKFVRNGIGYSKELGLTFFEEEEPFLTFEGSTFLDQHKDLFKCKFITNLEMITRENKELNILIENKLWKDACVKMGAILEYLLTKWIESKKISINSITNRKNIRKLDKVHFEEKINYYINTGAKKYNFEIGSGTEWKIVKNVIKDYRNLIHLQKYEKRIKKSGYLSERDFKTVYFNFNSLIELF